MIIGSHMEQLKTLYDEIEPYAAVKKAAIADGKTQPWSYQQAKTPYLVELEQRIQREVNQR